MTLLKRLVPAPVLSVVIVLLWLALARSTSPGQILLGTILALVLPHTTASLRMTGVRIRRPLLLLRYVVVVAVDVVVSNFQVGVGVILWRIRPPKPRFVVVPLDLRDPVPLAVLAMVTTIVPGTVWSELALDRSRLLLHVWDVDDDDAFIAHYKARYEAPLREIFQ